MKDKNGAKKSIIVILLVVIFIISTTFVLSYFMQDGLILTSQKDMWFDESFTALFIERSYSELLFSPVDVHPPLYYVLLKGFHYSFNTMFDNPYRAFSLMCGFLYILSSVFLFLKFAYNSKYGEGLMFVKYAGLIGFLFLSTTVVYYFNESRMYSLLLSLFCFSWVFYFMFEEHCDDWKDSGILLVIHYVLLAMCIMIHYYMIFGVIMFLLFIAIRRKYWFIGYVLNLYSLTIFGLTLTYLFLYGIQQYKLMENLWLPKVTGLTLFNTWMSYFVYSNEYNTHYIFMGLFVIILLLMPIINCISKIKHITNNDIDIFVLYYIALFLPVIGIVISTFFGAYHHRYFLFCSVIIIPLVCYYIFDTLWNALDNRTVFSVSFITIIIFVISFLVINQPIEYNTELNNISMFLSDNATQGDIIIHSSTFSMIPMMYYTNDTFDHYLISINVTQKQLNTAGGVVVKDRYKKIIVLNYTPELNYNSTCELLNLSINTCHHKNIYYLNSYKDIFKNNSVTLLQLNGISIERVRMI